MTFRLEDIALISGHHEDLLETQRGCVNDVISVLSGCSEVRDDPPCVCRALNRFSMRINDIPVTDKERTEALVPLVPLLMESNDEKMFLERVQFIYDAIMASDTWRSVMSSFGIYRGRPSEVSEHYLKKAEADDIFYYNVFENFQTWISQTFRTLVNHPSQALPDLFSANNSFSVNNGNSPDIELSDTYSLQVNKYYSKFFQEFVGILKQACLLGLTTMDIEQKQEKFEKAVKQASCSI